MAETGFFPSYHNNGRPRKAGDIVLKELRVRGLKDGMIRSLIDDGADKIGPNQARAHLLRKISAIDPKTGQHLFYVDEPVPPVPGPLGPVQVRVIDDAIRAAQAEYMGARAAAQADAERQVRAKSDAAETAIAASKNPEAMKPPKVKAPRKAAGDE